MAYGEASGRALKVSLSGNINCLSGVHIVRQSGSKHKALCQEIFGTSQGCFRAWYGRFSTMMARNNNKNNQLMLK